jgi:hypothetical protein
LRAASAQVVVILRDSVSSTGTRLKPHLNTIRIKLILCYDRVGNTQKNSDPDVGIVSKDIIADDMTRTSIQIDAIVRVGF